MLVLQENYPYWYNDNVQINLVQEHFLRQIYSTDKLKDCFNFLTFMENDKFIQEKHNENLIIFLDDIKVNEQRRHNLVDIINLEINHTATLCRHIKTLKYLHLLRNHSHISKHKEIFQSVIDLLE